MCGRVGGGRQQQKGAWEEELRSEYIQDALYICMQLPKNKDIQQEK